MSLTIGDLPIESQALVVAALRKGFQRSIYYKQALQDARVEIIRYKLNGDPYQIPFIDYRCTDCKETFKRPDVQVDHIDPVVPIGTTQRQQLITDLVARIYTHHVQVMCKKCHNKKSAEENAERRKHKKSLKKSK